MENWKAIPCFDGFYEVSNEGNVRSLPRNVTDKLGRAWKSAGRNLRPGRATTGYYTVALCVAGKKRSYTVHELVAAAFIGERPKDCVVDHMDGDRSNNMAANLRYVPQRINARNITKANARSGALGVYPNGKSGWQAQIVLDGKSVYLGTFRTVEDASAARMAYEQQTNHRQLA